MYNLIKVQAQKDTIVLNQIHLIDRTDTVFNLKKEPVITKLNINNLNKEPLNGFYKIFTDKNNYFITNYKNGLEDNSIFNYKITYKNGKLIQFDIKGNQIIGSKYISIINYNCKEKNFKAYYVDTESDAVIEQITIKQKVELKRIKLIIRGKNNKSKIFLSRNILKDCKDVN